MASTKGQHHIVESPVRRRPSGGSLPPPEYDFGHGANTDFSKLHLDASTSTESLPQYESAVQGEASSSHSTIAFEATNTFQIDAQGHPLFALPICPRPDPIPIYSVLPTGQTGPLLYQSIRAKRRSGNCILVRESDESTVCSTTYRFGPNRPPSIRLLGDVARDEAFEVRSKGCHTRAQNMSTHLGTFQWRYASRAERKAVGASSLLILDIVTIISVASGKQEERRQPVAHFIRNEAFRTQGTGASTAGNGGRLLVDLRPWFDTKNEAQQAEVFAIASCLSMLKKEVDRRRRHQLIVIAAGASGGC
ncbi:hypothetical protein HIM_05541 [Hirsutella minnesotensis 3608]|uniref:Uncharacterized protein n=1 Tax=Hirsutella minnesotensis 3608 TaxID=1043627 RepID=A0A0F7ZP84_9HYPO|nr:hypothetical protein HIM_05541 [Hirsutella minnesotensis 3608]